MEIVVSSDADTIAAAIDEAVSKVAAAVSRAVITRLVDTTPIDTHFAQRSWYLTIGEQGDQVAGSKADVNHDMGDESVSLLDGYTISQGQIFINNNVPYILVLNAGHSKQAPVGFIETAIEEGVESVYGMDL